MGNQMKFKKRVSGYFEAPMRLGFFLLLINILILFMHWPSGLVLLVFTMCYFVVVIALRMHSRALVINEMVSFATEYGQVQKRLLKNLELPYCVLDDTGRIIWTNYEFDRVVHEEKTTLLFPSSDEGYSSYRGGRDQSQDCL